MGSRTSCLEPSNQEGRKKSIVLVLVQYLTVTITPPADSGTSTDSVRHPLDLYLLRMEYLYSALGESNGLLPQCRLNVFLIFVSRLSPGTSDILPLSEYSYMGLVGLARVSAFLSVTESSAR